MCQDFPFKNSCPTVPKNALGEPFSQSLISGIEIVLMRGWAVCQVFPPKIFRLTVPKNALGEPFSHSIFSGFEKVLVRGW